MIRRSVVANQFYPGNKKDLEQLLSTYAIPVKEREKAIAIISPHAGYIYSGRVTGALFSSISVCNNIILVGPNHTGLGENASIMESGAWEVPTGILGINSDLAQIIVEESDTLVSDVSAHLQEHSLEVQLPFITHCNPEATIVPITIMRMGYGECENLAMGIARAIEQYDDDVMLIASSDMNHYEPDRITRQKDKKAIERVLALDAMGLLNITAQDEISMCGVIPAVIIILTAKKLGASCARLVDYATSGETSGDYQHVVGYAGMLIK